MCTIQNTKCICILCECILAFMYLCKKQFWKCYINEISPDFRDTSFDVMNKTGYVQSDVGTFMSYDYGK